ncbi:hypothetical protein HMPREF9489_0581 [Finegoldia magna SY403409CC001050417]|uniref:Uncharacterized protein n=1 Tax=Finegoldia magna TaxID=1260 RepID=A0A7D4JYD6_FINMA|nr:DUF859 family phage minor structural protein [Finegoldia magna]EGS34191.1 hypothetical protein HMPREF9489_0581 [Finegoldia magna SY403409CC001050417]QKH79739.1 hypothetical protein FOC70_05000 [Finegoldia magna]QKH79776.1 hypothetical protein FOC70_05250 [Finegoldia magna]
MATYTGTAPSSLYAYFKLDMNVISQSEADNTSRIRYRLYLESRGGGSGYSQTKRATSLICNNQTIENTTTTYSFDKGGSSTLCSGTFTITHNSDGTMSFPIQASVGTHRGTCSLSATMTLPTIARAKPMSMSIVDSVADTVYYANIGDSVTINVTNISGRSGNIRWETDNYSGYVGSLASSTHFTFSSSTFSDVFGSESSGYVTFTASADDGTTASRTITLRIFEIKKPNISYVSVREGNSQVKSVFGSDYFYTNISDVSAYVSAEAYNSASIEKYLATLDGYTTYSDSSTINIGSVTKSGERNITFEVVDSRNQRASYGKNIRVKEYNPPTAECSVTRQGEGLNASVKVQHTVSGSTDKNTCNVTVDVRELPSGSFSTKYSANINIASTTQSVNLGSGYKEFASYEVRVTATDKFRSYTALVTVPTQAVGISINPKSNCVGIGKFPDKLVGNDNLEVKGDIFAKNIEANLTLKAWDADIDYLNVKEELKIDDKKLDIDAIDKASKVKPFAEYNSTSRLDTDSTRDLFGTADLGPVSYSGSIGGFAYSDVIRVNFPYYVNSISYLNMCMVGTSDTGIFPFIISYDSSGFRLRVLNIVNSNTTNRLQISYHARGEN